MLQYRIRRRKNELTSRKTEQFNIGQRRQDTTKTREAKLKLQANAVLIGDCRVKNINSARLYREIRIMAEILKGKWLSEQKFIGELTWPL